MATSGFPRDDYTPHGYLANPFAIARSWSEGQGGNLRSIHQGIGFGWLYPWARNATAGVAVQIALRHGRQLILTRADFESLRLSSPHHSANLFEYAWMIPGRACAARFVLVGGDELGLEVEITPGQGTAAAPWVNSRHTGPVPGGEGWDDGFSLYLLAVGWRSDAYSCRSVHGRSPTHASIALGAPFGTFHLAVDSDLSCETVGPSTTVDELLESIPGRDSAAPASSAVVGVAISIPGPVVGHHRIFATLRRQIASVIPTTTTSPPANSIPSAIGRAREQDDRFWSGAARLEGDWPASWRRGWVYDLETTRMCVFPEGGVFRGPWPAWMIQWPRVVLAEGSLDALRLAYGDPALARTVALTLLRDATAPNVPCIFQHGEPNMVAIDGSVCGTSPAWCVPFYNLDRLYLRTLDRGWLAQIYEPLDCYLRWWLRERKDRHGWAVYKCTWEAGEDDTPRLDPERRGDNIVSEYVRPVELQATMALSAGVLARSALELSRSDDAAYWASVAADFADRTQQLWDPQEQRFRDWDSQRGAFLRPSGEPNYWGIDPSRHSVLSLTPLLAGIATPAQIQALAHEIAEYARPPWTLWPSWGYVLLESALAAGQRDLAGRVAADIVGRVYAELDHRAPGEPGGPTPGVAREYWPLDLADWNAGEGYGWGATTASLLIRQIFGFLESEDTRGIRFRLSPWLPAELLIPGSSYAVVNLPYRGHALNISYFVRDDPSSPSVAAHSLLVSISSQRPSQCKVVAMPRSSRPVSSATPSRHCFTSEPGEIFDVELLDR